MKNNLYFFIFFVFFSCDPGDDRLTITNNTNHAIVIGDRIWVSNSALYLDNKIEIDHFDFYVNQIEPKISLKMIVKGSWDSHFLENDTIVILVFNRDSIVKRRLKKPFKNYEIEQMIYVSHGYVKKNDWKINIDPKNTSKIVRL